MKDIVIASVEAIPVRVCLDGSPDASGPDYQAPAERPTIYSPSRESVFVRIESEDGLVGWGEALVPVGPRVVAAIVEDLLVPALVGADAADVRPLRARLGDLMRERGHLVGHQADALAAVDIALWDLLGHATGLPVATLLGGAFQRRIPSYVTSVGPATDAGTAQGLWDDGVRRFKMHLGPDVDAALTAFDAFQAMLPAAVVAADLHCRLGPASALRLAQGLQDRGAWFVESALPAEYLRGYADLAAAVQVPIAAGEAHRNRFEVADWLAANALDFYQPDIGRTGITEGNAIATLVNTAYRPILPHHSAALGLALAAGLHVAAAAENAPFFEYSPATLALANSVLAEPIQADADAYLLPDGPGLGVVVDEDKVRAAAVDR